MALDDKTLRGEVDSIIHDLTDALEAKYFNILDSDDALLRASPVPGRVVRLLFVTGTYACGEWGRGDNIDLVCVTNSSEQRFWGIVLEKLHLNDGFEGPSTTPHALQLSYSAEAPPPVSSTAHEVARRILGFCRWDKARCTFTLYYAHLSDITTRLKTPATNSPSGTAAENMVVDMVAMSRDLACAKKRVDGPLPPDYSPLTLDYSLAYRSLRQWAIANGLFGRDLGYLSSETLLWTIHNVWTTLVVGQKESVDDSDILRKAIDTVLKDAFNLSFGNIDENDLGVRTPSGKSTTAHMTSEAKRVIEELLLDIDFEGNKNIIVDQQEGWRAFLQKHDYLLQIEFETWAQSAADREEFEHVVRRVINDIVFYCRHPEWSAYDADYYARVWPEALKENQNERGTLYAIGLVRTSNPRAPGEALKDYTGRMIDELKEKAYTGTPRNGRITVDRAEGEQFLRFLPENIIVAPPTEGATITSLSASMGIPTPSRFRTAGQAINRLRYDPAHMGIQYDLAYDDRFDGRTWMALEEWGKWATEDDNFIPEHRVRQIMRREDGVVVWDRFGRVDKTGV